MGGHPSGRPSRAITSTATWPRPRSTGSRNWASPSTSTASLRRSTSGITPSGGSRRPTTSMPTRTSFVGPSLGSGSRRTSSPAPRIASPLSSTRGTSTTWSARSTSSGIGRWTTRASTSGRTRATPAGCGPATSRRSPRRCARTSSTSSPTPTWSRSGGGAARSRTATRASSMSPR